MIVNTGHKTFDKLANSPRGYAGRGNVVSAAQLSTYVRAHNDVAPLHGVEHPEPGRFQRYDMQLFKRYNVPNRVAGVVKSCGENQRLIVYMFRTWRGHEMVTQGWVVTDESHRAIHREYCSPQGHHVVDGMAAHLEAGK